MPGKGSSPPCSPKRGPYGKRRRFPEHYLTYPSGSLVKEPSLQVPLTRLPQTETLRFQAPPLSAPQSPWSMSHLEVLERDPYEERCLFPEPSFTHPSGFPLKQPPPTQARLTELPWKEMLRFQRPPSSTSPSPRYK